MMRIIAMAGLTAVLMFFSTVAMAQNYRVQPGDTLRIEVIEDATLNRTVLVSPDGRISVPSAGALRVSGRTIEQIQAALSSRLAANFINPPSVFVDITELAPEDEEDPVVNIYVSGEAISVGRIELEPGATLMQAIGQFGGFTNFAATKRIQLRRGSHIYQINYHDILNGISSNGGVRMREGDVIVVPQRKLFE